MAGPIEWVKGYQSRQDGPIPNTYSAHYSLSNLAERGFLPREAVAHVLLDAGLRDFGWRVIWAEDYLTADEELLTRISDVDGYAIFVHGWTGSNLIWEDMPAEIARFNRQMVSLAVDHNGFGMTPFAAQFPDLDQCSPVGAMRALEHWLDLLQLRRQPGETRLKTINFVGHSMGGAALFFLNEANWKLGEATRLAIAPALLLHDDLHRTFYTTLGLGIGLAGRLRALEPIEHALEPSVIEVLADGATQRVKDEHTHIFDTTPNSVTARTFVAMGQIRQHPATHTWDLMRVVLGHRDRLVGLIPMIDLLQELGFDVDQLRVVMGTHYLFSVGDDMRRWHEQNRMILLDDILKLHEQGLKRQKTG